MLAGLYLKFTQTVQFLSRLRILSFQVAAIERFERLKRSKLNIGKMHLRIGAIALEGDDTVISRNLRDFGRVPGLRVEDWSK
jgi:tRNA(fMet)-specific endonuclease VapC